MQMHIHTAPLAKPSIPNHGGLFPHTTSPTNPRQIIHAPFPPISPHHTKAHSTFSSKSIEASVPKYRSNSLISFASSNCVENEQLKSVGIKDVDVATLGNLCVDIVLNVPQLPPASVEDRRDYMKRLSESSPDKKNWEAGGNCNMAIATARLGLRCITIGHVGNEIYGNFLLDVLHDEGIGTVGMSEDIDVNGSDASYETLLCWVLVDPLQRHGFCSRADFSKEPAFSWMTKLSREVKMAIKRTKILFCNGYGFDELSPGLMTSALDYAVEVGTSVFFDPGPRGKSLSTGTPEEQRALGHFLRMSDVLLLTSDEAESLTGIGHPIQAGKELLKKGVRTKWVIIKMGAKGSILITMSSISCAPAFKVNVIDTVGCGDSFVAAVAFGFIQNMSLVSTLAVANAVGAATAMGCGAGRNVATLKQVLEIMREPSLNEDDKFWNEIVDESLNAKEITFLTKAITNGSNKWLNHVALQKAVSELLLKLESVRGQRGQYHLERSEKL